MDAASAIPRPVTALRLNWRVTPIAVVTGLTLLGLGLRLIHVGSRPLWLDEAYSEWFSARSWHYLWTIVPTYEPHPPFYYSILKLWRSLFGGGPATLRGLSVLLGVATIPVMAALAAEQERHHQSGRPHLAMAAAAFLGACSPMLVLLQQEARPYALLIFAFAIAILGLLRLMREWAEGGAGTWRSWLLLAAGSEFVLWAHGLGLLYAGCIAVALLPACLTRPLDRARLIRGLIVAAAIALAYAPCLLMIAARTGDWGTTGWLKWEPAMLLQLLPLYSVPVEVLTVGSAVAALALLLLVKRALQCAVQNRGWNAERAILLLWLGPPAISALVSAAGVPIFLARGLGPTLVPAYLAIASALARTPERQERTILAAALGLTLVPTAMQIGLRPPTEQWDEVGAYLRGHVEAGDQIWLYPNDSALPLRAAGANDIALRGIPGDYPAVAYHGPIRAGSPAVVSITVAQAATLATDPALKQVRVIWLVTRQSAIFDPHGDMPAALARVRRPGSAIRWGYIDVRPYYRR
jgi:mannosyltransferase